MIRIGIVREAGHAVVLLKETRDLGGPAGAEVELLTVFDQASQARFPSLVKRAEQPTKTKLDAAAKNDVEVLDEAALEKLIAG